MNLQDVLKKKKTNNKTVVMTNFRLLVKYKEFIEKNNISIKELVMRACEELEPTLKEDDKNEYDYGKNM